jgi:glycolate oxidase iron-sulfur subunit
MQTHFSIEQLQDPKIVEADGILRSCVHCGFCTATCPSYVVLGDELDSPRGRIYLVKNMLEQGAAATAETTKHIDRCLSCLACMTTCPSSVNYRHLIDQARYHVEATYARPMHERILRNLLAFTMPRPQLFRLSLIAARLVSGLSGVLASFGMERVSSMLALVPKSLPRPEPHGAPGTYGAIGKAKGRVALLMGCVQSVLEPSINAATVSLLTRLGYEVVVSGRESCCGSLTHHMGKEADALVRARRSIDQWLGAGVEAVVITASGCGSTIKDYGHMLRHDPAYAGKALAVSAMAKDITEFLSGEYLPEVKRETKVRVAYHSACSMQHGQNIVGEPLHLLRKAGFEVAEIPEGHLCCGSAGTYNILQPAIAAQLLARKVANIKSTAPEIIATGNIGCITQIASALNLPVIHTVELLDWAYGGERPVKLNAPSP